MERGILDTIFPQIFPLEKFETERFRADFPPRQFDTQFFSIMVLNNFLNTKFFSKGFLDIFGPDTFPVFLGVRSLSGLPFRDTEGLWKKALTSR